MADDENSGKDPTQPFRPSDRSRHGVSDTGHDPVSLPWSESADRELRDFVCTGTIVLLTALFFVSVYRALRGAAGDHWGAAAFSLVLAILGWFIWYGPMGGVAARASVDSEGLWVRHLGWRLWPSEMRIGLSPVKHLPAAEIGQVTLMVGQRRRELWRKAVALDFSGRRVGWTKSNLDRDTTIAVLIEQRNPQLKRPWWSLKCHDCDALAGALRLARDQADVPPPGHD